MEEFAIICLTWRDNREVGDICS